MLLVIQATWLLQYQELSHLGSEYEEKQNRCCKLVVLPKFQSKYFMQIQEHPSVDDSEGNKKRLHGVSTAWFIVKWFTVPDFFIHLK